MEGRTVFDHVRNKAVDAEIRNFVLLGKFPLEFAEILFLLDGDEALRHDFQDSCLSSTICAPVIFTSKLTSQNTFSWCKC